MTAAKRTQRMCQGLMSPDTMAVVGPIISIPTVCFMTGKESGGLMCAPLASVLTHDPVYRIYKAKILGEPPPRWWRVFFFFLWNSFCLGNHTLRLLNYTERLLMK